jgi:hypothetical protein
MAEVSLEAFFDSYNRHILQLGLMDSSKSKWFWNALTCNKASARSSQQNRFA